MSHEDRHGMTEHQHGLTLLEIIIAVGILAILLAIGFPQFAAYQRGLTMREISDQTSQLLRDTGTRARAETREVTVNFLLNRPDGDDFEISNGTQANRVRLERDAQITDVRMSGLAKTSITFDTRGRPKSVAPLIITVTYSDLRRQVRLLTTGKTVIQ